VLSTVLKTVGQPKPNEDSSSYLSLINADVSKTIHDIIYLVTGYDIFADISKPLTQSNDDKEKIFYLVQILSNTVLKIDGLKDYLHPADLISMLGCLQKLSSFSIKTVTDKKFQQSILSLLYSISGQVPDPKLVGA
jgi:hypothetical protein